MKHQTMRRALVGLLAAAGLLAGAAGFSTAQTPATTITATPAGGKATPVHTLSQAGHYLVNGARIRTSPSTGSTTVGYGYTSHNATVYCRRVVGGVEWFYHTDTTTNVSGWSRYDVLVPFYAVGDC
ncbi:hypothetical protein ACFWA5_49105 [Streptomyces mirabilis]|uniref:hypothetical protein n=1 Tax=Streptomyces mirabilis TaxID=68239 RepID=UPI003648B4B3